MTAVTGVVRAEKWWDAKVAPVVAVAGLSLLAGPSATGDDLVRLVLFVVSAVGIAAFGHLVNDAADRDDDVRAGKSNPLVTWSGTRIWGAALLSLTIGVAPWTVLDARPAARWFLLVEPLLLVLYAVRPFRLKGRGLLGAVTDAAYAYAVPLVWTLAVFAPDGPVPVGVAAALGAWSLLVGLRSILWHQLADLDGDRRVGARTAAVRLGKERTVQVVARALLPLEVVAGITLLVVAGAGIPWLPWAFAAYLVWRLFEVRYLWQEPLLPAALHDPRTSVRLVGYVVEDQFVARWLPIVVTVLLAVEDPWWWLAVAFVLVAFQNAVRDLLGNDIWGVPDALERVLLDVRAWFAIRQAAHERRARRERGPQPVSEQVRATRRWVFVACGADMHLITLAVATEHLRALSSLEIWVVTDTSRNSMAVDETHVDRVVDVRTDERFDHHQASIWLKTGLGDLLPVGEWCYLDTDVIAVTAGAEAVFDVPRGPVAFASDLTHFGNCVDHFSTYAMTCSCREQRTTCGHLREQLTARFDLDVPGRWLHWNGGVFVFGPEARPFLALWQERAVASFDWPEWRTRDQGALIASVWTMGFEDLPRLPRQFNFIADFDNPDLSFDPARGWAHHPQGPWIEPVFLHLYTSPLHEEAWDFGRDTEQVLIRKGATRLARYRADDFKSRAKYLAREAVVRSAHGVWNAIVHVWWALYRSGWAVRRGVEFMVKKSFRTLRRLTPGRIVTRLRKDGRAEPGSPGGPAS